MTSNELLAVHIARHMVEDMRLNAKHGYFPAGGVLGQRDESMQRETFLKLGLSVRADFWTEGGSFGFRSATGESYHTAAAEVIRLAKLGGFKVSKHGRTTPYYRVKVNAARVAQANALLQPWIAEMLRRGALTSAAEVTP